MMLSKSIKLALISMTLLVTKASCEFESVLCRPEEDPNVCENYVVCLTGSKLDFYGVDAYSSLRKKECPDSVFHSRPNIEGCFTSSMEDPKGEKFREEAMRICRKAGEVEAFNIASEPHASFCLPTKDQPINRDSLCKNGVRCDQINSPNPFNEVLKEYTCLYKVGEAYAFECYLYEVGKEQLRKMVFEECMAAQASRAKKYSGIARDGAQYNCENFVACDRGDNRNKVDPWGAYNPARCDRKVYQDVQFMCFTDDVNGEEFRVDTFRLCEADQARFYYKDTRRLGWKCPSGSRTGTDTGFGIPCN
ncbi:hypothetical protein IE53DRAFT_367418 [Violaceomyces palustris]|uniref:Uncharacterized protein n=1 Tax=Violaceomyces palustris TaxID=1673888 RepID=A0ACD0P273_9BASI|nr:hypothetical protein IE53DRAFT_367418 [Violaceomyces palustris]